MRFQSEEGLNPRRQLAAVKANVRRRRLAMSGGYPITRPLEHSVARAPRARAQEHRFVHASSWRSLPGRTVRQRCNVAPRKIFHGQTTNRVSVQEGLRELCGRAGSGARWCEQKQSWEGRVWLRGPRRAGHPCERLGSQTSETLRQLLWDSLVLPRSVLILASWPHVFHGRNQPLCHSSSWNAFFQSYMCHHQFASVGVCRARRASSSVKWSRRLPAAVVFAVQSQLA